MKIVKSYCTTGPPQASNLPISSPNMVVLQMPDIRSALHVASSTIRHLTLSSSRAAVSFRITQRAAVPLKFRSPSVTALVKVRSYSTEITGAEKVTKKNMPSICTADELHYVNVANSDWRLALWRYAPCPQAPSRNHPLLLLSGVGTNAIGYDLSPDSSFARYMSGQGFETWILEVRGAGLSIYVSDSKELEKTANEVSERMQAAASSAPNETFSVEQQSKDKTTSALTESKFSSVEGEMIGTGTAWDESILVSKLTKTFMLLSERLSGFVNEGQSTIISAKLFDQISKLLEDSQLSERFNEIKGKLVGLLETRQTSGIASQIKDLSQRLVDTIEEGQRSVSPPFYDLQDRFASTIEDFQKQLDLIVKYDWDFDHYLEEDVHAAMEYIRAQSRPKDGKLLAIGHSMGGILLYAMLSRCGFGEKDPGVAAVVTLASSLDYTSSNSSLKLLIPLGNPAQALNVPVVPLGTLLAASYPISSRAPYVLSWLTSMISAQGMMHPELLKRLVLNNFCTIPVKLLLQLTTAFREGGLCDRSGTFFYKDHLSKCNTPVLALAGDQDLICPPEAVEETVKLFPENMVTYKAFGEQGGPHYAHYDLVGGRLAVEQVYPCIVDFLVRHDSI